MNRKVLLIFFSIFMVSCQIQNQVCFDDVCIDIEIADTPQKRATGLMHKETLDDKGMLFVFDKESIHSFWMKNTLIPLDMIWISSENKVVHIESAYPCKDICSSITPSKSALYVLEADLGFAERHGIKVGSPVKIRKNY